MPVKRRVNLSVDALADAADVLIYEASCAQELVDLGFDKLDVAIKVAITPFGRTGPKSNWRATPSTILAMGGYTNIMGDEARAPLTLPGHYLEFQTGAVGYTAAQSLLHAKRSRPVDGVVDIGMLETLMSLSQFTTVLWHCAGEIRGRHGSDFWSVAPSDLFRCADGWVYINIVPAFWDPFVALVGSSDLLIDPRFENNDTRMANRDALRDLIAEAFLSLPRIEIDERAETYRVPLGVVRTMDDVLAEEHLDQRSFLGDAQDGRRHSTAFTRVAVSFRSAPAPKFLIWRRSNDRTFRWRSNSRSNACLGWTIGGSLSVRSRRGGCSRGSAV